MSGIDLGQLAEQHFKGFIRTMWALLVDEQARFDLVIGAGNSGVAMLKLLEALYRCIGRPMPPVLRIPIVRVLDDTHAGVGVVAQDALASAVAEQLRGTAAFSSILLVDDEIYRGTSARVSLDLVLRAIPGTVREQEAPPLVYTIVAEDSGWSGRMDVPRHVAMRFSPFATAVDDVSNVVLYFVPPDFPAETRACWDEIAHVLEAEGLSPHVVINVALDTPIKEMTLAGPRFTFRYHELVRGRVQCLQGFKRDFAAGLAETIARTVAECEQRR